MTIWHRFLCWLLGHVYSGSYWSVPKGDYRCLRCREMVKYDGDGR